MRRSLLTWGVLALAAIVGQFALWPARADTARPFALVKDIKTAEQPTGSMFQTKIFGTLGGIMLFNASTPQTGNELWRSDGTTAGTRLVKDILPGELGAFDAGSDQSVRLDNRLLFTPIDAALGQELWTTDGTPAGTTLVYDLVPGAKSGRPREFVVRGKRAFFLAQSPQSGLTLWISDGTPAGTTQLHAFSDVSGKLELAGDTLFFTAAATGGDYELWKSDGTVAGTVLVKDIHPGPAGGVLGTIFVRGPREVWFNASDGAAAPELWTSDGTANGTHRFRTAELAPPIGSPSGFAALRRNGADITVFSASDGTNGTELWASDGTPAGTAMLKDANPNGGSFPSPRGLGNGALAFYALDDGTHGLELWATDGTPAGTFPLQDINPGSASSSASDVITVGPTSYFAATSANGGRELWRTDGTAGGTAQVADINPGAADSSPQELTVFDGRLYFKADAPIGRELWRTDGARTDLVQDFLLGDGTGVYRVLGAELGALFLAADDGTAGVELWKSDGTPEGTALLKNIAPDTGGIFLSPGLNATARGNSLVFGLNTTLGDPTIASAPNAGGAAATPPVALWQSDGSEAGTTVIKSLANTNSSFAPLYQPVALGDNVLFAGDDGLGVTELWRSDGTGVGTTVLTSTVHPYVGFVTSLTRLNDLVVFNVYTSTVQAEIGKFRSLWASDGTAEGTRKIAPDLIFDQNSHAVSGNTLFFAYTTGGGVGHALWATDGTAAGTREVSKIVPGRPDLYIESIAPGAPGEVFLVVYTSTEAYQLWRSDGTADGTRKIGSLEVDGRYINPKNLTYANGRLFFSAGDAVHGDELWSSDGTSAGTGIVANIFPGAGSSNPRELFGLNGVLYFSATTPDGWRTLWQSDGTAAGTRAVRNDADAPLDPYELTAEQGQLIFSAASEGAGREPWRSDGTAAGTRMLQDIVPGPESSDPGGFVGAGQQFFFTADTPGVGRELWALAQNAPGQPTPTLVPGKAPASSVFLPLVRR